MKMASKYTSRIINIKFAYPEVLCRENARASAAGWEVKTEIEVTRLMDRYKYAGICRGE